MHNEYWDGLADEIVQKPNGEFEVKKQNILTDMVDLFLKRTGLQFERDTLAQLLPAFAYNRVNEYLNLMETHFYSTDENVQSLINTENIEKLFMALFFTDINNFENKALTSSFSLINKYFDISGGATLADSKSKSLANSNPELKLTVKEQEDDKLVFHSKNLLAPYIKKFLS